MDAKPMSADYNERVACWSMPNILSSLPMLESQLMSLHEKNPHRFEEVEKPFTVAEYGCATGYASIWTLEVIIRTVKKINQKLPILVYLNDLPNNHHEVAIKTIEQGLFGPESKLEEPYRSGVFLYVAGKDFTKAVFPEGFVDFGYSCMAAATLPNFPAPLSNCYYFASDSILQTEGGQAWVKAYKDFLSKFLASRQSELKVGGIFMMVTSTYSADPVISAAHIRDEAWYQGLYNMIYQILTNYGIQHLQHKILYSWCVMRKEVIEETLAQASANLKVLEIKEYPVPDCFKSGPVPDSERDAVAKRIALFQHGYWAQTITDTLAENGVSPDVVQRVYNDIFNIEIPKYCKEHLDDYPEMYCGMYFFAQKT